MISCVIKCDEAPFTCATEVAATDSQSPPTRPLGPTKVGLRVMVDAVSTARRGCHGVCVTFGVLVNVGVAVGEGVISKY